MIQIRPKKSRALLKLNNYTEFMTTTSFNLPPELITRLDSMAAADGRSRSSAARFYLEAALNADAELRRQAAENFERLKTAGGADQPARAGERDGLSSHLLPAEGLIFRQPSPPAEVFSGSLPASADYPLSQSFTQGYEMKPLPITDNAAHLQRLQEDALRRATEQDAEARRVAQQSPLERIKRKDHE